MTLKTTILFLDHTARMGGGEIAILNLIRALDKSRFEPIVVLASDGPLAQELIKSDIETETIPLDKSVVDTRKDTLTAFSGRRMKQAWTVLKYAVKLARWASRRQIDIIHTNSLKADIYGGIAGRLAGIPVIWHVRDNISEEYLPGAAVRVFRLLARVMPDIVITNSQSTLRTMKMSGAEPAHVVYSGVTKVPALNDDSPQNLVRSPGVLWPEQPVVALIGRIAEWKGQHVFIRAASQVLKQWPKAMFWIVGAPLFGEHDYEASLRTLTAQLGVENSVKFLGFKDNVHDVLKQVSIVVHASTIGEPFGQVVIEGMAAGKPVVATNGGALPEIIEPAKTGMLVPMGDSDAMAKALEWLLAHPDEAHAMALAGKEQVRSRFTIEHTAAKVQAVYDSLKTWNNGNRDIRRPRRPRTTAVAISDGISQTRYEGTGR